MNMNNSTAVIVAIAASVITAVTHAFGEGTVTLPTWAAKYRAVIIAVLAATAGAIDVAQKGTSLGQAFATAFTSAAGGIAVLIIEALDSKRASSGVEVKP